MQARRRRTRFHTGGRGAARPVRLVRRGVGARGPKPFGGLFGLSRVHSSRRVRRRAGDEQRRARGRTTGARSIGSRTAARGAEASASWSARAPGGRRGVHTLACSRAGRRRGVLTRGGVRVHAGGREALAPWPALEPGGAEARAHWAAYVCTPGGAEACPPWSAGGLYNDERDMIGGRGPAYRPKKCARWLLPRSHQTAANKSLTQTGRDMDPRPNGRRPISGRRAGGDSNEVAGPPQATGAHASHRRAQALTSRKTETRQPEVSPWRGTELQDGRGARR